MTEPRVPAPAAAEAGTAVPSGLRARLRTPIVQLNAAGIVLVAIALVPTHRSPSAPALVLGVVALACWAWWVFSAPGRVRDVALLAGALTAALGAGLGAPSLLAPMIAAFVVGTSDPARRVAVLVAAVIGTTAVLAVAAIVHGQTPADLLSLVAGAAIGALGGTTRRARRIAEQQERALLARTALAEREAQRAQLLEARSAAARDVHDVLAHSLGGLVLQLDAIEALLENGRVDEAATRAAAARRLAGEGLSEARRAVAALRDPEAVAPTAVPDDALDAAVAAHRALGGEATARGDRSLTGVDGPHREALARALQEALTNARRHAPGSPVSVEVVRGPSAMIVRVTNAVPAAAPSSPGGGHGLAGMRERFALLGDGSAVTAGPRGGEFVVEATAVLA